MRIPTKNCVVMLACYALLAAMNSAQAQATVKVGVIAPLTGPLAFDGQQKVKGAGLAAERFNADSKGNLKIQIVAEDGECKPAGSAIAAEKLISQDKVVAIIGGFCSGATLAIMPIAEKARVPLLTSVASLPKLTEMGNRWFFRIAETEEMASGIFSKMIVARIRPKNVFYIAVNDDWGRGAVASYKSDLEKAGVATVGTEFISHGASDFYTPLTKIKGAKADLIVVVAETTSASVFLRQAKELGISAKIYGVGAWGTPAFLKLVGDNANGILAGVNYSYSMPGADNDRFVRAFLERNDSRPSRYAAAGFNGMSIMIRAIEMSGNADSAAVRDALEKVDYIGPNGRYRFNSKRQAYGFDMVLIEIRNGEPIVLEVSKVGDN